MADALCGPSNPLQSFQKHSQIDRTLQQDRLVGPRHSPAQGFRSHDPRAGSLDAEFAAFEAGPSNPFQFEQAFQGTSALLFQPLPATSNWAADFQKLQISNQPIPSQQFRVEAPLVRSNIGGWHDEFLRQRHNASPSVAQGKQAVRSNGMTYGDWSGQAAYMAMNHAPAPLEYSSPLLGQDGTMDGNMANAELQKAFDDAFQNAERIHNDEFSSTWSDVSKGFQQESTEANGILHQDGANKNDSSTGHEAPQEAIRIGSDAIHYTEQKDRTADQDSRDADELARTAGQLLHSIQHDTSTKFQQSQFLALMRKIRDKEVEVRNEDFQATAKASSIEDSASFQLSHQSTDPPFQRTQPDALQDFRPHDTTDNFEFQFPDLNNVYNPHHHAFDDDVGFDTNTDSDDPQPNQRQPSPATAFQPQSQIQALHPGGRWYPEQFNPEQEY